jgi:flagellar biosynthesis/type III secretory pathway M-ring protein FliF/YscJ
VEAFPFESTLSAQPMDLAKPAAPKAPSFPLPGWLAKLLDEKHFGTLAAIGAGAMLLLVGVVVLALRAMRGGKKMSAASAVALAAGQTKALEGGGAVNPEQQIQARMAEHQAQQVRQEVEALMSLKLPGVATKKTDVLVKHIAAEAKKDPTAMAQVVRSWMDGKDQR